MKPEVSVSYQAVKSRVYRLIDSVVNGEKSASDVKDSFKRWWETLHPNDRPVARKYLSDILAKSTISLEAIHCGISEIKDFEPHSTSVFVLSRLEALRVNSSASH